MFYINIYIYIYIYLPIKHSDEIMFVKFVDVLTKIKIIYKKLCYSKNEPPGWFDGCLSTVILSQVQNTTK